jgi:DUF1707 SHOCT-like domain
LSHHDYPARTARADPIGRRVDRICRVTGDPSSQQPDVRLSDADRERVVARLQSAVSEGRLDLDEFQERVDAVLRCRTFGEIERFVADLPAGAAGAVPVRPREVAEIRGTASTLRRRGRWAVPRRLRVISKAGSVRLNFTEAVIGSPVVEIDLDVVAASTVLVLPEGASVDADDVQLLACSVKVRGVPTGFGSATGPHFVVRGSQKAGNLVIRHQRRFWRWRW